MPTTDMQRIGIRELQQETGKVLAALRESGEPVLVTFRGRAVAALVPVEEVVSLKSDALERLAEAEQQSPQPAGAGR